MFFGGVVRGPPTIKPQEDFLRCVVKNQFKTASRAGGPVIIPAKPKPKPALCAAVHGAEANTATVPVNQRIVSPPGTGDQGAGRPVDPVDCPCRMASPSRAASRCMRGHCPQGAGSADPLRTGHPDSIRPEQTSCSARGRVPALSRLATTSVQPNSTSARTRSQSNVTVNFFTSLALRPDDFTGEQMG